MVRNLALRVGTAMAIPLLASALLVTAGPPAAADQGEPLIAGETNTEERATVIVNTSGLDECGPYEFEFALVACGVIGVDAQGTRGGVLGTGPWGVLGGGTEIGVWGQPSEGARSWPRPRP